MEAAVTGFIVHNKIKIYKSAQDKLIAHLKREHPDAVTSVCIIAQHFEFALFSVKSRKRMIITDIDIALLHNSEVMLCKSCSSVAAAAKKKPYWPSLRVGVAGKKKKQSKKKRTPSKGSSSSIAIEQDKKKNASRKGNYWASLKKKKNKRIVIDADEEERENGAVQKKKKKKKKRIVIDTDEEEEEENDDVQKKRMVMPLLPKTKSNGFIVDVLVGSMKRVEFTRSKWLPYLMSALKKKYSAGSWITSKKFRDALRTEIAALAKHNNNVNVEKMFEQTLKVFKLYAKSSTE